MTKPQKMIAGAKAAGTRVGTAATLELIALTAVYGDVYPAAQTVGWGSNRKSTLEAL